MFQKIAEKPGSHGTKRTPPTPSPRRKKKHGGRLERTAAFIRQPEAPLQGTHTALDNALTSYEEGEMLQSIQKTLVCNESRTAGAVQWRRLFDL